MVETLELGSGELETGFGSENIIHTACRVRRRYLMVVIVWVAPLGGESADFHHLMSPSGQLVNQALERQDVRFERNGKKHQNSGCTGGGVTQEQKG